MEAQLVLFLALTTVSLITNAVLIYFAYRFLSRITSAVNEVKINSATRTWVASLQTVSAQAVTFTETAKQTLKDSGGDVGAAQEQYAASLRELDAKLDIAAQNVSATAEKVRDAVARPAFSIVRFASRLRDIGG